MAEAVRLALEQEAAVVPRQEGEGILRFDEAGVGLGIETADALARGSIVSHEVATVLTAGQLKEEDVFGIGRPGNIGEIAVRGVACPQIYALARGRIEDSHGDFVARHARHGIFLRSGLRHLGGAIHFYVDEGKIRDHALVHAVESQQSSVGTPECALVDAELIAVDGGSVEQLAAAISADGEVSAIGGADIEVMLAHVCRAVRGGAIV